MPDSYGLEDHDIPVKVQWPSTLFGEFFILLTRSLRDNFRNKAVIGANFGQSIFLSALIGLLYFNVSDDAAGVQNRLGVFFFLSINLTFGVVGPSINVFPDTKRIIKRERAAGSYRPLTAFMAVAISGLPLAWAGNVILGTATYWIVGLEPLAEKYFIFMLIIFVQTFTANGLGLMIGSAVPNATVGQIVAPLVIIIFFLFGGLLVNLENLPAFLRWIQWVSPITYCNKAFAQNEFNNLALSCQPGSSFCYSNGSDVIQAFSLGTPSLWYSILINVCLGIGFLLLGSLAFVKTSAPLMRLK